VRTPPVACKRFESITAGLALLDKENKPIGLLEARKLLMSAEQGIAAHSVYFHPDTMAFDVALTRGNVMSPRVAPTAYTFAELFAKK
jgi:hypothetical protein